MSYIPDRFELQRGECRMPRKSTEHEQQEVDQWDQKWPGLQLPVADKLFWLLERSLREEHILYHKQAGYLEEGFFLC